MKICLSTLNKTKCKRFPLEFVCEALQKIVVLALVTESIYIDQLSRKELNIYRIIYRHTIHIRISSTNNYYKHNRYNYLNKHRNS